MKRMVAEGSFTIPHTFSSSFIPFLPPFSRLRAKNSFGKFLEYQNIRFPSLIVAIDLISATLLLWLEFSFIDDDPAMVSVISDICQEREFTRPLPTPPAESARKSGDPMPRNWSSQICAWIRSVAFGHSPRMPRGPAPELR